MNPYTTRIDPFGKLTPTTPNTGCQPRCFNLASFKRVGVLLAFHLSNTVVAIGGAASVVLLLASMALMPFWFIALLLVALAISALHAVQQIPNNCLMFFGYVVLIALYIASLSVNWYITVGPYAILAVGAVGVGFFFLSAASMKVLLKIDAHLANFVNSTVNDELDPDECMDRFKLSQATDVSFLLPYIRMTRRLWVGVFYFVAHKLVIGVLSVVVLVITVILPALVIFSGNGPSYFGNQVTLHDNPVVYIVVVLTIWLVGAIGMPVVAVLSVKLTSWVCGEWKSEQDQTTLQENQVEVAIPVTPESASSTTSFTVLNSTTPIAQSTVGLV